VREIAAVSAALEGMSGALRQSLDRQTALEEERRLFVGAIAHDLRTPLFALRTYLEGLEAGLASTPEKSAAYLRVAREKADALERLIADLFAYTRLEYLEQTIEEGTVDLGALLRASADGMQPQAEAKGVAVTVDGPPVPAIVQGDAHLLLRAVGNLLDNALRHTPTGGRIALRWEHTGSGAAFTIADSGPGIATQDLPHLFTPLYRGEMSRNRQTGGAGLGLTIARRILQAHGGTLTAANGTRGGAVFTGTLPITRPAPPPTDMITAAGDYLGVPQLDNDSASM
jgi:signal transduction histidine kinase